MKRIAVVLLATIALAACDKLPCPPFCKPTPTPTPTETPTPPVPTPTPPIPTPTPPVPTPSIPCDLPDGSSWVVVANAAPVQEAAIGTAMAQLCQARPDMFVNNCTRLAGWDGGGAADRYFAALGTVLQKSGICAGQPVEHGQRIDVLAVLLAPDRMEDYHLVNYGSGDLLTPHNAWLKGGTWAPPGATPPPTPGPTPISKCPPPAPPHVFQIVVKVHQAFCANIDTTTKVKNDAAHPNYCASVGFYDQNPCPTRLETDPNRAECDKAALGGAQTWSCDGCLVYPCSIVGNCKCGPDNYVNTNPAQAVVVGHGTLKTCDAAGVVCGKLVIP